MFSRVRTGQDMLVQVKTFYARLGQVRPGEFGLGLGRPI
jgi:hypothetical protein